MEMSVLFFSVNTPRRKHPGNRHRGESHLSSPATPPYMRVRIRRFDRLVPRENEWAGRSQHGDAVEASLLALASIAGFTRSLPTETRRSGMASAMPHRDPKNYLPFLSFGPSSLA
jgi:hypothetical protein